MARRIEKIDLNADPNGTYELEQGKIYAYWDFGLGNVGIIKQLSDDSDNQVWHNCVISRWHNRWNSGNDNATDLFNSVLKWNDCEIWEFDSAVEFLTWALEKLQN